MGFREKIPTGRVGEGPLSHAVTKHFLGWGVGVPWASGHSPTKPRNIFGVAGGMGFREKDLLGERVLSHEVTQHLRCWGDWLCALRGEFLGEWAIGRSGALPRSRETFLGLVGLVSGKTPREIYSDALGRDSPDQSGKFHPQTKPANRKNVSRTVASRGSAHSPSVFS